MIKNILVGASALLTLSITIIFFKHFFPYSLSLPLFIVFLYFSHWVGNEIRQMNRVKDRYYIDKILYCTLYKGNSDFRYEKIEIVRFINGFGRESYKERYWQKGEHGYWHDMDSDRIRDLDKIIEYNKKKEFSNQVKGIL